MTALDRIIGKLQQHADELRAAGVLHASVFGSLARGEDRSGSDVDVLVTLDPQKPVGLIRYAGISRRLNEIIGRPVDIAERGALKPLVRDNALRDEVRAF